jgi:hypothetical protein
VAEEGERRAVAAGQPCDEVRPLGRPREQLGLDAVRCEVVAQALGRDRLVARRVDRVQLQQLLQRRTGKLSIQRQGKSQLLIQRVSKRGLWLAIMPRPSVKLLQM